MSEDLTEMSLEQLDELGILAALEDGEAEITDTPPDANAEHGINEPHETGPDGDE